MARKAFARAALARFACSLFAAWLLFAGAAEASPGCTQLNTTPAYNSGTLGDLQSGPTIPLAAFTAGDKIVFAVTPISPGFLQLDVTTDGANYSVPMGHNFGGTQTYTINPGGSYGFVVFNGDGINSNSSLSYTLTCTAAPAPTITLSPVSLPATTVGVAYNQSISASGGTSPYAFAITSGSLPPGLTLASDGTLSGTATAAGTFNFAVTATDAAQFTGSRNYALTSNPPVLSLSPADGSAFNGTAGSAFSQSFTVSGGTAPYSYALAIDSGAMPSGLSFDTTTGTLSGTPTSSGSATFTVTASDSSSGAGAPFGVSHTYSLTIAPPTIVLSPSTLSGAAVGAPFNRTISASGGIGNYSFAITAGALPAGLSLASGGGLGGTPTAGGTFNFTVTATDSDAFTGSQAYALAVAAPTITLAPALLPGAQAEAFFSQTLTASGGTAPYVLTLASGALPPGVALSSAGTLSGTPTAAGTLNFSVAATDASTGTGPYSATQPYTVAVTAPAITLSPATLPAGTIGAVYAPTVSASGGAGGYTFAVTAGALPNGVQLGAGGAFSGTATAVGVFGFTVTATDGFGFTGVQAYSVTIDRFATTTTLTSNPNPAAFDGTVVLSATITGLAPTGTVAFRDGAQALAGCAAVPVTGGTATCTTFFGSTGSHALTAVYGGDATNAPSTSAAVAQVVGSYETVPLLQDWAAGLLVLLLVTAAGASRLRRAR